MAEINRLVWEKGDFGAVAPMGWDVGEVVVGHVGVKRGERVVDVACGTGNAAIRAAQRGGTVTGLDIVPALLDQGRALAAEAGVKVEFVEGDAEDLPFEDASFDVVISNGVINLSPVKARVFTEAARVLRPGGRLALADIVSAKPLKEKTRRNTELWAACIAGAIPRRNYAEAIEQTGLQVGTIRENDYRFISDRALDACSTYGVESVSLVAEKASA